MTEEKMHILLCEDDENLGMLLREYLQAKGIVTDLMSDGEKGYKAFQKAKYDLCVLDVMMPKKDGFTLAQDIRAMNSETPIIFLTAKNLKEDILNGFKIGADDYITKPFSPKELVLRVKAVIRRYQKAKNGIVSDDSIVEFEFNTHLLKIEREAHRCLIDEDAVSFTAAEWRVLLCLVDNAHLLVSRGKILEDCFDYSAESYERIVDTHIKNIRAKLGDGGWIETVRGYGYRFVGVNQDEDA